MRVVIQVAQLRAHMVTSIQERKSSPLPEKGLIFTPSFIPISIDAKWFDSIVAIIISGYRGVERCLLATVARPEMHETC